MEPLLTFKVNRTIPVTNELVWRVLGDFGREHRWTKSVLKCERDTEVVGVGTSRTCMLPKPLMGRTSVRECLSEYDPGRSLAYALEGPAGPFATAASRWSTTQDPTGGTRVCVEGFFTPRGWGRTPPDLATRQTDDPKADGQGNRRAGRILAGAAAGRALISPPPRFDPFARSPFAPSDEPP